MIFTFWRALNWLTTLPYRAGLRPDRRRLRRGTAFTLPPRSRPHVPVHPLTGMAVALTTGLVWRDTSPRPGPHLRARTNLTADIPRRAVPAEYRDRLGNRLSLARDRKLGRTSPLWDAGEVRTDRWARRETP